MANHIEIHLSRMRDLLIDDRTSEYIIIFIGTLSTRGREESSMVAFLYHQKCSTRHILIATIFCTRFPDGRQFDVFYLKIYPR